MRLKNKSHIYLKNSNYKGRLLNKELNCNRRDHVKNK
jgi:hypothetical protein